MTAAPSHSTLSYSTLSYSQLPALMTRMTGDEKHGPSATSTLDVLWVLYHHVLRVDAADPVDALRATLTEPDVVIVEPYLAGTSTAAVAQALGGVRHRLLALGVGQAELRRYGTTTEHDAAPALDTPALRHSIDDFLTQRSASRAQQQRCQLLIEKLYC